MAERVDELRAALEAKDREIAGLRAEVERVRAEASREAAPTVVEPRLRPLQEVEADYANEVLAYRSVLEAGLQGYSLEGVTLYRVDGSGAEHAYRTRMSLRLAPEGSSDVVEVTLPVTADILGRWTFPEPEEVMRQAVEAPAAALAAAAREAEAADSRQVATGEVDQSSMEGRLRQAQVVGDSQPTVVVEWADGATSQRQTPQARPQAQPQAQARPQQQAQPQAQPQPQQQAPPRPGPGPMRSDEEVLIEF